jgi:hypothetical protein
MNSSGIISIGAADFAQETILRSVLGASGLRGPLALSVQVITQAWTALDDAPSRISLPLAAATSILNPWDDSEFFEPFLGSFALYFRTTTAGRTREFFADLAAGTYQLPPCDELYLGVQIKPLTGEAPPAYGPITVSAAVTPGSVPGTAVTPLVATIMGRWDVPGVATSAAGYQVRLPEATRRWRAGIWGLEKLGLTLEDRPRGDATAQAAFATLAYNEVGFGYSTYQREWADAPRGTDLVGVRYGAVSAQALSVPVYPYVQCELTP